MSSTFMSQVFIYVLKFFFIQYILIIIFSLYQFFLDPPHLYVLHLHPFLSQTKAKMKAWTHKTKISKTKTITKAHTENMESALCRPPTLGYGSCPAVTLLWSIERPYWLIIGWSLSWPISFFQSLMTRDFLHPSKTSWSLPALYLKNVLGPQEQTSSENCL